MKRQTWIWGGLVTLGVATGLGWAFRPQTIGVDLAVVQHRDFRQWLVVDGTTHYEQRQTVGAPVQGIWSPASLREGDALAKGAVIGQMRPLATLRDARTRQELTARSAATQARWAQAQAQWAAVQAQRRQAEQQLQRDEALARTGFISPAQLDLTRLALGRGQAEEEAARSAVQAAREDWRQAQAALQALPVSTEPQADSRAARFPAEETSVVRVPQDSIILRVHQSSPLAVAAGVPLIEVGVPASVEVVAEVLTDDALALRPGLRARVGLLQASRLDGRLEEWSATLTRVEPSARTQVSALGVEEQRVTVHLRLDDGFPSLGDGWRVNVRLLLREAEGALTVDSSAVFPWPTPSKSPEPDGNGSTALSARKWAVMRVEKGVAHLREVQLQARQSEWAWLSSGLQTGDRVVSFPPAGLKDGDRVQARP
jgi:HlyD family secretion protein